MAESAADMDDPTVPGVRAESWTPVVERVLSGHLDEGPEYSTYRRRGTTDWLLIHTVRGAGRLVGAEGAPLRTAAGDAVLVRPRIPHDYGTAPGADRWEIVFSHFHPRPGWTPL